MKIRVGFVSNSSSSSFVCDICGKSEVGFDCDPEELGFERCENEHLICEDEAYGEDLEERHTENNDYGRVLKEEFCPICLFEVSSKPEIKKYLKKRYNIEESEVFAIVKEKNKRRKKLYDSEYVNYIYEKFNIQEKALLVELKEKYVSYSKFLEDLHN